MLSLDEIVQSTNGKLLQEASRKKITQVVIDSRKVKPGNLFVAVKGENFDGHSFLKQAVKKGAAAVVVSKKVSGLQNVSVIRVKDTISALGDMAAHHRLKFKIPIIAITGSAGKTTTKEMLARVLKSELHVLKNQRSENNQFGVPLTLFRLRPRHDVVVLELGTNQPGDIAYVANIARPDVAIFTNIGSSHLQGLKNIQGVFKEKSALAVVLPKKGKLIYNGDDAYLRKLKRFKSLKHVRYGLEKEGLSYRADDIELTSAGKMTFRVKRHRFKMNTVARHNLYNALAVICCSRELGISYNNIIRSLSRFRFSLSRLELKKINGLNVFDDSYNANPVSFFGALESLSRFPAKGKRIVICSDMLELGEQSRDWHERVGREAIKKNVDCLIALGKHARYIYKTFKQSDHKQTAFYARSMEEVYRKLSEWAEQGDVILVKGSRRMKMERVVEYLIRKEEKCANTNAEN